MHTFCSSGGTAIDQFPSLDSVSCMLYYKLYSQSLSRKVRVLLRSKLTQVALCRGLQPTKKCLKWQCKLTIGQVKLSIRWQTVPEPMCYHSKFSSVGKRTLSVWLTCFVWRLQLQCEVPQKRLVLQQNVVSGLLEWDVHIWHPTVHVQYTAAQYLRLLVS